MDTKDEKIIYYEGFIDAVLELLVKKYTLSRISEILEIHESDLHKIFKRDKKEMTFEVYKEFMDKLEKHLKN
tara:strand:+ start:277 stop:492 length:216 start_codon:yes stop_codon:yes gene_type:complete